MLSQLLIVSYILDWVVIIAAAAIALALSNVNPDFHTFSLLDLSISYPYRPAKVSLSLLIILAIVGPIVVIAFVSLYFPPRFSHSSQLSPRQIWQHKLWQLNATLMGLGVSLATSTVIFTGVKNLTGKPRPDFLQRCLPDLENIAHHIVGGFGHSFSELWVMVDVGICQQTDKRWRNDGFRSFPSAYASIAFAGLWYLSLFLTARFIILPPNPDLKRIHHQHSSEEPREPLLEGTGPATDHTSEVSEVREAAAPPVIFLLLPYIPLGLAIFIAGTRYFDFRNHGVDVVAGAAVGSTTAWWGFRLYHSSPLCHMRYAWGPRRNDRAFRSG